MTSFTALPLRSDALPRLPANVRRPDYDRAANRVGIVHIGVGNFFRAHQAVYLDDLLHTPGSEAFGYCGVGLLPQDRDVIDGLRVQDGLYTLVTRDAETEQARVVGSLVRLLHAPQDPAAVIEQMASSDTKIVSLTITEGGYGFDSATAELDNTLPDIAHDLAAPNSPRGVYGYLAAALRLRRKHGIEPFTVMSCDNLQHNGDISRRILLAFLRQQDAPLADWIAERGSFPNTMVDRITPVTSDAHRALVRDTFGVDDRWPVTAEPFRQWVIEDRFPLGRPVWERVGAQIVNDLGPYEKMKIGLLNGSHQVMCYLALLMGQRQVHEAVSDPQIRELLRLFMDREVTPLLPPVTGIDLAAYKANLIARFANPAIADQLLRIATDASARVPKFVLPTVVEQLDRNGPIDIGALTVAAWFRTLGGRDDAGDQLVANDPMGTALREAVLRGDDAAALLALPGLFDPRLIADERFPCAVQNELARLGHYGARRTLADLLARLSPTSSH